jgi:predicted DCC family thiol-disulfide oxidoreductase YuxK
MSESGMNMKSTSSDSPGNEQEIWIVYDGLCPFCSRYVLLYRIRELVQKVHLIDARDSDDPLVSELSERGFDLNEGMAARWNGRFYYGADCLHVLALLGSESTIFNRLNRWIFSRRRLARVLYPILVTCRKLTLRILGRPPIENI